MEFRQHIYGLYADGDRGLRYIGRTKNVRCRFDEHLRALDFPCIRAYWIANCLKNEKKIHVRTLETIESDSKRERKTLAIKREMAWIEAATNRGIRLLNNRLWLVGAGPPSVCNVWLYLCFEQARSTEGSTDEWQASRLLEEIEADFPRLKLLNYRYKRMYQAPTCM